MSKAIIVLVIIVVAIAGYFLVFGKKAEATQAESTATGNASDAVSDKLYDIFPAPSRQNDTNIREIPAQVGLSQMGLVVPSSAQDAIKSLLSGDMASEDAIRALDLKNNTVLQTLVGNPISDATGGQKVRTDIPSDVTAKHESSITNPAPKKPSINRQVSNAAQKFGSVIDPRNNREIISVGSFAKQSGREIITTKSGKKVVSIGNRVFETRLNLSRATLDRLLKSERLANK